MCVTSVSVVLLCSLPDNLLACMVTLLFVGVCMCVTSVSVVLLCSMPDNLLACMVTLLLVSV